ncbi:MAG: hypothetical protein PVH19_01990 [Planctomycetia bacterium]|jgi:hypothetical protein
MHVICPHCNQPIAEEDYNISTDIAYCRACDSKYSLATLAVTEDVDDATFDEFRRAYCQELGRESIVEVPFRKALRLLGMLAPLVLVVMAIPLVLAYRDPKSDFQIMMMVILPACVPDLLFAWFFFAGKYVVTIESGFLKVRTGVFPIQIRRHIDLDPTTVVHLEKNHSFRVNGKPVDQIVIKTGSQKIAFGVFIHIKNKMCLVNWIAKRIK